MKVQTPPTIDGVIDDAEWKDVTSFDGLADQVTGAPCPESGQFWLAYDAKFIYFAARLGDSKPQEIKAVEYRSNSVFTGDDSVTLNIDLSGSLVDFSTFTVNPRGATGLTIAGGRAAKREWLGEFLAKARITQTGWEMEARIPWKVLPVPGRGKRNARFNVSRFIARLQETFTYEFTPVGQTALTPYWNGVEMPQVSGEKKLLMLPYTYVGADKGTGAIVNSGVDVRYPMTDTVNLVGTINPDFRNIENQILSLDYSRFERVANETRPFFLEGRNYYSSNIYISQRISAFDAGVNVYGKLDDKTSFGLLDTEAFGSRNNFVFNATKQPNPNLSIRGTAAIADGTGVDDKAYMVRANLVSGPVSYFVRGSVDSNAANGNGVQGTFFNNYNKKEWTIYSGYETYSPTYNPLLGFVPENDLRGWENGFAYTKNFNKGPLITYGLGGDMVEFEHYHGGFYRRDWDMLANATLRKGLSVNYLHDQPNFEGQKDHFDSLNFTWPSTNPYRNVTVGTDWGTQEEEPYTTKRLSLSYRTLGKLDLKLTGQIVNFMGYSDQVIFSANYDMGHDRALTARVVKQGSQIGPYIAYRRSGNAGAEYFLILGDPNTPQFRSSLILKVTFPLEKVLK